LQPHGPILDRSQEHLGPGDLNVIRVRQLIEEQIRIVEDDGEPLNVFRDAETNQCLKPHSGFRRSNRTPDGGLDRPTAARKYSPLLSAAVAREQGDAALTEPVH
jgi:hypothetical protein